VRSFLDVDGEFLGRRLSGFGLSERESASRVARIEALGIRSSPRTITQSSVRRAS
jgi:hypothetical protein